jgi:hypothetical protein
MLAQCCSINANCDQAVTRRVVNNLLVSSLKKQCTMGDSYENVAEAEAGRAQQKALFAALKA